MSPSMPAPDDPRAPKYWMHETSGVLIPAVGAYLHGEKMTIGQIAIMRAYLRQWIMSPVWQGEGLEQLRRSVEQIQTRREISEWLEAASKEGHDPL